VKSRKDPGYHWPRIRDPQPAFGIEAAENGVPMHFIQSALGHSSVAVTERYYAKFAPDIASKNAAGNCRASKEGGFGTTRGTRRQEGSRGLEK